MIVSRRNRCSNTSIHCTALSSPTKAPAEPIGRPVNDINHRTSPLSHIKNIIIIYLIITVDSVYITAVNHDSCITAASNVRCNT